MSYQHPLDLPPATRSAVLEKIEELKCQDPSFNVNVRPEGDGFAKIMAQTRTGRKLDRTVPKTAEAICTCLEEIARSEAG